MQHCHSDNACRDDRRGRDADGCSQVSGRNGSLGRSVRYRFLQRVAVRAAASIRVPQPGSSRGSLALSGQALPAPRLGANPYPSTSPGSTGTRGSGDRLMPALHRCQLVRDCARVTTPAGDTSHRSRSAHRSARSTPLVRHESPVAASARRTRPVPVPVPGPGHKLPRRMCLVI
jgi:hypothetical protein